jgi:hypothetical protein
MPKVKRPARTDDDHAQTGTDATLPTTCPQPAPLGTPFAHCPLCGGVVLVQTWGEAHERWREIHAGKPDEIHEVKVGRWTRQERAQDPVCGDDHAQRCEASAGLKPLWIKDGKGGERFAWLALKTGEILEEQSCCLCGKPEAAHAPSSSVCQGFVSTEVPALGEEHL